MKDQLENIAKIIIQMHGFYSNTNTGFSCIIPDKEQNNEPDIEPDKSPSKQRKDGLVLWVFSIKNQRFETQFRHFKKPQRIKRMKEMLNLQSSDYKSQIENVINKYAESLLKVNGFSKIGEGIIFENSTVFNLACSFNFIKNNPNSLLEFEEFTINNPIVEYCEKNNYFECKKKNEFFAKNKKYL